MKAKTKIIITTQIVALALLFAALGNSVSCAEPAKVSADEALKRLIQGNARFVAGHMAHVAPEHVASARRAVAKGQTPFAVIVGFTLRTRDLIRSRPG
jgi:carbonic anhydrase